MLLLSMNAFTQSIPEGYKLLGSVNVENLDEPDYVFVSQDGKIIAIEFGGKNSVVQIFDAQNWSKLGEFKAKGWAYLFDSFLDRKNNKTLYITARGNKMHRYNFETHIYDLVSRRKVKDPVETDPFKVGFASISYHGNTIMYMLPEQFIITCNHETANVYVWESLIEQEK